MKILWVTSFNKTLFDLSGKKLVESFVKTGTDGTLLVCHENMNFTPDHPSVIGHELSNYPFLKNWLKRNENIIPTIYGGKCEYSKAVLKNYWNVKASLWFRKIASLHMALSLYGKQYDAIVWIDSDCLVTKKIDNSMVQRAFGDCQTFYHLGPDRSDDSIESGLIGFKAPWNTLHRVFKMYDDGSFKNEKRWDDGYIFKVVLSKTPTLGRDVVSSKKSSMQLEFRNAKRKDVIHRGPFREYVIHNKGQHKKQSKIYCPPKPTKAVRPHNEVVKSMGKLSGL